MTLRENYNPVLFLLLLLSFYRFNARISEYYVRNLLCTIHISSNNHFSNKSQLKLLELSATQLALYMFPEKEAKNKALNYVGDGFSFQTIETGDMVCISLIINNNK